MKRFLGWFIIAIVLFSAFFVINVVKSKEGPQIAIEKKETALKIGRALLEEHFPDAFLNNEILVDAVENDENWMVHNIKKPKILEDGNIRITSGGYIYVEFRKSDGKILKIGLDD